MKFTDVLQEQVEKIWNMEVEHPFVKEMGEGSLDLEKFKYYSKQNYHYLKVYDKIWALALAKCDDPEISAKLFELLKFTLTVEIELMKFYAKELGVTPEELEREEISPVTRGYIDFLFSTALSGDLSQIMAAVTPCLWGYMYVFTKLKAKGTPKGNPLYAKSIELYTSDEGKWQVDMVKGILDKLAERKSEHDKEKLKQIFLTASRYEYLFWEQAYRKEVWPDKK
ncbi:MAG: thiaminase II [Methanobacteriota archaeon]